MLVNSKYPKRIIKEKEESGYIPTQTEIADQTKKIRDSWTDEERSARYIGPQFKVVEFSPICF